MYDFILAYHNPKADGTPVGADLRARLPQWPSTGLTFDGSALPAGITSRNIGGVTAGNSNRKGASGGAFGTGQPNENFVGNITVPMAKYISGFVDEIANTNIIGDISQWDTQKNLGTISAKNIGLMGNYDIIELNAPGLNGVVDIIGKSVSDKVPQRIANTSIKFLSLWNDVSRETNVIDIPIVFVRGTGGQLITTGIAGYPTTFARVIIYAKKYTGTPDSTLKPHHRTFVDSSGQVKLTGPDLSGIDAKYLGSNSAQPVPALDEAAWITAGNNGTTPANLATNYAALDPQYKWSSLSDFNTNAVE
jgi:hypothetical protein